MKEYSKSQQKIVATAHTAVSLAIIIALVAAVAWIVLKGIAFAAQAVVPVAVGFFLALFFKPYFLWLKKKLRYPVVALIVMFSSVFVPTGTILWWTGSTIVEEFSSLGCQIPETIARATEWVGARSSYARELFSQIKLPTYEIGKLSLASQGKIENVSLPMQGVSSNLMSQIKENVEKSKEICSSKVAAISSELSSNRFATADLGCTNSFKVSLDVSGLESTSSNIFAVGAIGDSVKIDVETLKELYSKYGDQIKKAGVGIAQTAKSKVSGTAASSGVAATGKANSVGGYLNKIGLLFAGGWNVIKKIGASTLSIFSVALYFLVTCIFFVYFLMSDKLRGGKIVGLVPMLKDSTRRFVAEQIDSFVRILVSFYQRQIVICIIEGFLYGFGFWVVGLPYGFIIGFLLGCLNLVPFFGSLVCIPLAVIMAYFGADGSGLRVVLVLVVWIIGQILDGYYITPKIQGDKTGLGYAGVIFSFLFWPIVLGPMLGLLLAIPLSACCVVLWRGFCDFTKHKKVF